MKTDKRDKGTLEYVPGAADDGMGFFPVITCQIGGHPPKVLWVVHQRRRQLRDKQEALSAANAEIGLAFQDRTLPSAPPRFLEHLRQRGFSELADYRVAASFDQDRPSALGDEYQPTQKVSDPLGEGTLLGKEGERKAGGSRSAFVIASACERSPETAAIWTMRSAASSRAKRGG